MAHALCFAGHPLLDTHEPAGQSPLSEMVQHLHTEGEGPHHQGYHTPGAGTTSEALQFSGLESEH